MQITVSDNAAENPEAARNVRKIPNVENYLECNETDETTKWEAQALVRLLALGSFSLLKFDSKFPATLFDPNSSTEGKYRETIASNDAASHVLGLKWNHRSDLSLINRKTSPQP